MKKFYSTLFVIILLFVRQSNFAQPATLTYSYTGTIQTFTVPTCVYTMTIQAKGAQGGYHTTSSTISSGLGANMLGVFSVTPGMVLKILVGQMPSLVTLGNGGGGGSFVTDILDNPLIVAGGGGGSSAGTDSPSKHGQVTTSGGAGAAGGGLGGTNGNGGSIGSTFASGAGGGLLTNGQTGWAANTGGIAFVNGGLATSQAAIGGFGGGGSGSAYVVGGGGGGYSGGGAGSNSTGSGVGGGGGSFNAGTNQVNIGGSQTGHGEVILSYFQGSPVSVSLSNSVICSGSSATFSASGVNTYTWSTGSQAQSITVSPPVTTVYTVSGTNSQNCITNVIFTVNVNYNPTVTAISSGSTVCNGNTVTLSGAGANTYIWSGGVSNGVAFAPSSSAVYTVTGTNACGAATATTAINVTPLIITPASSPTIVCSGSTATLSVSGASGYTWQPGTLTGSVVVVNPLVSTTYSVTGSLGACIGTANISVPANPVPTITASGSSSVICAGDVVSLSATGGINYTWTPGNLSGANVTVAPQSNVLYNVTGDNAFNCTSGASQIMIVNPLPTVNIQSNKGQICPSDNVTLTASGANSYNWSNQSTGATVVVNPSVTSVFTATGIISSTGCSESRNFTVNVFQPQLLVSPPSTICLGSSITLTASGATSYTWSNGPIFASTNVTPAVTTGYTVNAISAAGGLNCPSSASVLVTVNPVPTVLASSTRTRICKGEKAVLTASGAVTYTWSTNTVSASISVSPSVLTSYTVTGENAEGCTKESFISVNVLACNSLEGEAEGPALFIVYPNPGNGTIHIRSESKMRIQLLDYLGREIAFYDLDKDNNQTVRLQHLSAGVYFLVSEGFSQRLVINGDR